jgi:hypothetical protein
MVARCFEVTILITDKKLKTMEEIERLAFALNHLPGFRKMILNYPKIFGFPEITEKVIFTIFGERFVLI